MSLFKRLVFKHNLKRARHFKTEKDRAEYTINLAEGQGWGDLPTAELARERFDHCDRELQRYLRALGQEA